MMEMSNSKPYITVAGNKSLLSEDLKAQIVRDLPQEGVEWQRRFGRTSKIVYIEAQFKDFDEIIAAQKTGFLEGQAQKDPLGVIPTNGNDPQTNSLSHDPLGATNQHNSSNPAKAKSSSLGLLNRPLLHTYWTDCCDSDDYKSTVKDEINTWLQQVRRQQINDWMIIHVDNQKLLQKPSKLLPRASILDKMKGDFNQIGTTSLSSNQSQSQSTPSSSTKAIDRCIGFTTQTDSGKYQEIYSIFLHRLRQLLLYSYSNQLTAYEDVIRVQRESRNAPDWDFFDFFFLQEELAFAFEMLTLYDESLVQYDELDALFSQFVINSNTMGSIPEWLQSLGSTCNSWPGLALIPSIRKTLRDQLRCGQNRSLLHLRNYLFSRQCELLLLLNKPWEVASRSLPFLQNCVNELRTLEVWSLEHNSHVTMPPGGVACWVFLSSLEILQKCERYSDSSQMESYSLHTVGLWAYARSKLVELGYLCGLMPGMDHVNTSESIHKVVELTAGMGDDPYADQSSSASPQQRLKEALSSPEKFLKHYLEISELTMGTYKHIARMRSARLVGKDLAQIYMKLERWQQAVPFFLDLEKMYLIECWPELLADIRRQLFICYKELEDHKKQIRLAFQLAASPCLSLQDKFFYFEEAMRLPLRLLSSAQTSSNLDPHATNAYLVMNEIFRIESLSISDQSILVTNSLITLTVEITSRLPKPISGVRILASLKIEPSKRAASPPRPTNASSAPDSKDGQSCNHLENSNQPVDPDFVTFDSSVAVGVTCLNAKRVLRRSDSHGPFLVDKEPEIDSWKEGFSSDDLFIQPGHNQLHLSFLAKENATYSINQVRLSLSFASPEENGSGVQPARPKSSCNVTFISSESDIEANHVCFKLIGEEPSIQVLQLTTLTGTKTHEVLAGVSQAIILQLTAGSCLLEKDTQLKIRASRGLKIKLETDLESELKEEILVTLNESLKPFGIFTMPLVAMCQFNGQKDASTIQHQLTLSWPPISKQRHEKSANFPTRAISTTFHLLPPFFTNIKLHTFNDRKFIEILVHGLSATHFITSKPRLEALDPSNFELKPLLPKSDLFVYKDQTCHYMWEITPPDASSKNSSAKQSLGKVLFSVDYMAKDTDPALATSSTNRWRKFECEFKLTHYETLYTIRARIEPPKGSEFCRAGQVCALHVIIHRPPHAGDPANENSEPASIMYELIADQSLWSIAGRTAGVLNVPLGGEEEVTFDVMPLTSGFIPLPTVRLSQYLTSNSGPASAVSGTGTSPQQALTGGGSGSQIQNQNKPAEARLIAFEAGQIYNWTRATQVHILPSSGVIATET